MSLPVPVLDDRTFQELVNECKARIPRYCPEWTDHNISDPGVTLIELFAWMTDLLLYRINRIPDRNYIAFLNLMGVRLGAPRPATADITFRLSAAQPETVMIPAGAEVATIRTETQEAIVFTTERPLPVRVPHLEAAFVAYDEQTFRDYMPAFQGRIDVPIFREPPQPGNSFYLGYREDLSGHILALTMRCQIEGVGVDPTDPPLVWEVWNGDERRWQELDRPEQDTTGGLNRDGVIILHLPYEAAMREVNGRRACWLRCRAVAPRPGQPAYRSSPKVRALATESLGAMVPAAHSARVTHELLGRSSGLAGQVFRLANTPILPRRADERLEVQGDDGAWVPWVEVDDFAVTSSEDRHYTFDAVSGEIHLGPTIRQPDGAERQYGRIPELGQTLRFSSYRTGGGSVGNVGAGTLSVLNTSIPYIQSVVNRQAARGGIDAESVEAAKMRGPRVLRARHRAVTADDYEALALESSSLVARSRCRLAGEAAAASMQALTPGLVQVLLVPALDPSPGPLHADDLRLPERLRQTVMTYLSERRVIGTSVLLSEPPYTWVSVTAKIKGSRRADADALRESIDQALYGFLHPTVGGPDRTGWPFGRPLHVSELYSLIQANTAVEYVESLELTTVERGDGPRNPAGQRIVLPEDGLLCSAPHTVTIT